MLLSRFWYVVLALCLGASVFVLFLAQRLYNRHGERAMAEALAADSSAVGWYLRDDARRRAAALTPVALDPDLRKALAKATESDEVDNKTRDAAAAALKKVAEQVPEDLSFTAMWAVDARGRVIANIGYETPSDWELGGFSLVADALHGWIRDDAWVLKETIYRVVARPVQQEVNAAPVGAIVGARAIDTSFATAVTKRTGAAVGFYVEGQMVAKHAPEGFDPANLDFVAQDLKNLDEHEEFAEKGRSEVRRLTDQLGVVYARMPGEAWDLGAGYAVGRLAVALDSPMGFLELADDADQKAVPTLYIGLFVFVVALLGLVFSIFEHTLPLRGFHADVTKLGKGDNDVLAPSRFRGLYKKIASDLNDGIERVAAKGGAPRRAADLEEVLGPLPAQPQMSAFAVPGEPSPEEQAGRPQVPRAPVSSPQRGAQRLRTASDGGPGPETPKSFPQPQGRRPPPPPARSLPRPSGGGVLADAGPQSVPPPDADLDEAVPASAGGGTFDAAEEQREWRGVYEEFLATKKNCGESTSSLTFEKFKGTLERNKKALVERHNCSRVKFTVYVKDGRAALKASPVK